MTVIIEHGSDPEGVAEVEGGGSSSLGCGRCTGGCGVKVWVRFNGTGYTSFSDTGTPRKVGFLVLKTSVEGRLPLGMRLEVMAPLLQRVTPLSGMGGAGGDQAQSD